MGNSIEKKSTSLTAFTSYLKKKSLHTEDAVIRKENF